jgi:uncharacterized protein (TIGR02145 family)
LEQPTLKNNDLLRAQHAALAIGKSGHPRAFKILQNLLKFDDPILSRDVHEALRDWENINKTTTNDQQNVGNNHLNLNVDHYRNGDKIPEVQDINTWSKLKSGAWCYYNNDPKYGDKYGRLYNWYAIKDRRGLAPEGMSIPSKVKFEKLFLSKNIKSSRLLSKNAGGTNESEFNGLLGGFRQPIGINDQRDFLDEGVFGMYWSSTEVESSTDCYNLYFYNPVLFPDKIIEELDQVDKRCGLSIRCFPAE